MLLVLDNFEQVLGAVQFVADLLAAGQLSVLSPNIILERLHARAPFVLSGVSDLPARHRTLRAAGLTNRQVAEQLLL